MILEEGREEGAGELEQGQTAQRRPRTNFLEVEVEVGALEEDAEALAPYNHRVGLVGYGVCHGDGEEAAPKSPMKAVIDRKGGDYARQYEASLPVAHLAMLQVLEEGKHHTKMRSSSRGPCQQPALILLQEPKVVGQVHCLPYQWFAKGS